MRLMAREEDIYRLMDQRDQSLCCTGFCLVAVVVSIYFLMQGLSWERIYFLAVSGIGGILLSWHTWKENRRIMEAGCCYMELDGESLAVCQPEQDGRYESCRLFYNEVEKIVEGSRKGIPEFYVVVCPDQDRESFILLDDEEQARQIFCVRSLGYGDREFKKFYRRLRWEVPGRVRIIGTKNQSAWDKKKSHAGVYLFVGVILGYLIPKIFLLWLRS